MSLSEIEAALKRFANSEATRPKPSGDVLREQPYPGGRHLRTGFLEGAVDPQRETKVSVFTPWDDKSYVVVDAPEVIWSNLGLTYLAHTHVPTVWSKQQLTLPQVEWNRRADGSLAIERSEDGRRWIITAWENCNRPWANPPVPCMHSRPKFPDCAPGETQRLRGWLCFYQGEAIDEELLRLEARFTETQKQ